MTDREKLIELLAKYFDIGDSYAYNLTRDKRAFMCGTMGFDDFEEFDDETVADIADHLIANGVTIQKWIPVTERLPKPFTPVLVYRKSFGTLPPYIKVDKMTLWSDDTQVWTDEAGNWKNVTTHWMLLPQPPKGE